MHKKIVLGSGSSASIATQSELNNFLIRVKTDLTSIQYYINEIAYNIFRLGCYGPKWEFDIMQAGIAATTLQTNPEEHGGTPWGPECYWVSDGTPTGGRPATVKETFDCILAMVNSQEVVVETQEQDLSDIYDKLLCLANDDERLKKDIFGCGYELNCDDTPTQKYALNQHLYQIFSQVVEGLDANVLEGLNGVCTEMPNTDYPSLFISIDSCNILWSADCLVPQAFIEGCVGAESLFDQWADIYAYVGAGCAIDGLILEDITNANTAALVDVSCFGAAASASLSLSELLGLTAHEVCRRTEFAYRQFKLSTVTGSSGTIQGSTVIGADNKHDVLQLKAGDNVKLVGLGQADAAGDDEIEIHVTLPDPPSIPDSILGDLNDAYHFGEYPPVWYGMIALENTYEEANLWKAACKPMPGAGVYLIDDDVQLRSKLFAIVKDNKPRNTALDDFSPGSFLEPEKAYFSVGKHWGLFGGASEALAYEMEDIPFKILLNSHSVHTDTHPTYQTDGSLLMGNGQGGGGNLATNEAWGSVRRFIAGSTQTIVWETYESQPVVFGTGNPDPSYLKAGSGVLCNLWHQGGAATGITLTELYAAGDAVNNIANTFTVAENATSLADLPANSFAIIPGPSATANVSWSQVLINSSVDLMKGRFLVAGDDITTYEQLASAVTGVGNAACCYFSFGRSRSRPAIHFTYSRNYSITK